MEAHSVATKKGWRKKSLHDSIFFYISKHLGITTGAKTKTKATKKERIAWCFTSILSWHRKGRWMRRRTPSVLKNCAIEACGCPVCLLMGIHKPETENRVCFKECNRGECFICSQISGFYPESWSIISFSFSSEERLLSIQLSNWIWKQLDSNISYRHCDKNERLRGEWKKATVKWHTHSLSQTLCQMQLAQQTQKNTVKHNHIK